MSNLGKKRSYIWKHFTVMGTDKAKCEYCGSQLSFANGATGNLTRHMRSKHKTVPLDSSDQEPVERRQPIEDLDLTPSATTLTATLSGLNRSLPSMTRPQPNNSITNYTRSTRPVPVSKSKQLDQQVVKMIIMGYHPFTLVEEDEFKKLMDMVIPNYTLPSRKHISASLIPKLYAMTREKVSLLLADAEAICLTTDGWTSMNNDGFLAITAHFIDKNTQLRSFLLGCINYNERHTAQNLANFLKDEVTAWGINNKITAVVSDNARNIVAAIHLTNWRHFPCFAHTINLVVQDSLKMIKPQLEKVKSIVEYFKKSSTALSKLHATQSQMGLPELKLKQDVVTRWNSTFDMLERILKIKDAVICTLAIEQPELNSLSPNDWLVVEKSMTVLEIFNDITIEISSEKNVSISKVIIFIHTMKSYVADFLCIEGPSEFLRLVQSLHDSLNDRFKGMESNPLTSQSSFLDPRFKKHAFSNEEKFEQCLKTIKHSLSSISNVSESVTQPESVWEEPSTSNVWIKFDKRVKDLIAVNNPIAASTIEADKYLHEPLINRKEDPLQWWKIRKEVYPRLYKFMLRRLCIVATSVPCERVFSKAGLTISEKRSRLKPEKASQILFLNHNL